MKKIKTFNLNLFLLLLLTSFVLFSCGKKEDSTSKSDSDKKEQSSGSNDEITESTPIHYQMEATGEMKGTWDVYAKDKRAYVKMNYQIGEQTLNSEMWMTEDAMYTVTNMGGKKVGMKMDPKKWAEQNDKKQDFNPLSFKDGCKDCQKIGEEEIIGKKCVIYQDKNGIKYSVYKEKVPLKIVMQKSTIQAKSLEVNAKINDDMFTPPKDVEYTDMDKMLEGVKGMKDMKDLNKMKENLKEMEEGMKNYKK